MLAVTKKPGDKIHIGPDITITVIEIKGNKVRLGIDAPKDVSVIRNPDLARLIGAWPKVSDAVRRAVLAMIEE
jgi:carbon storage regulator